MKRRGLAIVLLSYGFVTERLDESWYLCAYLSVFDGMVADGKWALDQFSSVVLRSVGAEAPCNENDSVP